MHGGSTFPLVTALGARNPVVSCPEGCGPFLAEVRPPMRATLFSLLTLSLLLGACAPPRAGERIGEASDAVVFCPGPTTIPGIDVSEFQGDIDWNQVVG